MRTQREIAREIGVDNHVVAAVLDLHGIRPRRLATALVIDDDEFERIAPDLRKIRDQRNERRLEAVVA